MQLGYYEVVKETVLVLINQNKEVYIIEQI